MTAPKTGRGNWRALSDTRNSKGEPLVPFESGPYDDLWELLTPKQQQHVARGEVTLEQLVDRITSEPDDELCPRCYKRIICVPRLGLCDVCARLALADAHRDVIAELEALADASAMKKRKQRLRDQVDPDRPRGHAPFRTCSACGERLPARTDYSRNPGPNVCPACRDLRDRRHPDPS